MKDAKGYINTQSEAFAMHSAHMMQLIDVLQQHQCSLEPMTSTDSPNKTNQSIVQQRLTWLLDPHEPFFEVGGFAAIDTDEPVGGGAVAGIGFIHQRPVVIFANDPKIKKGKLSVYAYKKWRRALTIAHEQKLPYISLVESAGYDLDLLERAKSNGLTMPHFAESGHEFYLMARLSKKHIPNICVVFGSATAGGAYQPALSDYTIFVNHQAKVYLAGPHLVKMAIGEDSTHEALGGAELHAQVTGLADYLADDDEDACIQCRQLVKATTSMPNHHATSSLTAKYPIADLLGWLDPELMRLADPQVLLTRILDDASWFEYKPLFGPKMMCGWGEIAGMKTAVIMNHGNIDANSAKKSASFISLCNQQDCPIIFIHNNTGFIVGEAAEKQGIICAGAHMIKAMSNSTVPHISLMVGASYGAGTYAMCGPGFNPRFALGWPNAKCNVMGPEILAGVMTLIRAKRLEKPALDALRLLLIEAASAQEKATSLASELAIDAIIDPRDTRHALTFLLNILYQQPIQGSTDFGGMRL